MDNKKQNVSYTNNNTETFPTSLIIHYEWVQFLPKSGGHNLVKQQQKMIK